MASVTLAAATLKDVRLAVLMEHLSLPRSAALGLLVLFWYQTRNAVLEHGLRDAVLRHVPFAPGKGAEEVLEALIAARYINVRQGDYQIIDNAGYEAKALKRSERAKQAGLASAKKRLKKDQRPKKATQPSEATEAGRAAWAAYSTAFETRHGAPPLRNAKSNSLIAQLVKRVGQDDVAGVMRFYVQHNDAQYVRRLHPLDLAVRDAEALYSQYKSGSVMTFAKAQRAERGDNVRTLEVKDQLAAIGRGEI